MSVFLFLLMKQLGVYILYKQANVLAMQLADEIHPDRSRNKFHSGSRVSDIIDSTEQMLKMKIC